MSRLRLLVLLGTFALWPAGANAATGWWGWLEELSGPGPFYGLGGAVGVFCVLNDGAVTTCFLDRNPNIRQLFELRGAFLWSGDRPRFDDRPSDTRTVHAFRLDPVYMFRLHRTVDVGAGAGFVRFSGDGFDPLYRFTITPLSVSFAPFAFAQPGDAGLRRLTRAVRVRFDETYVTKGFTGADFGDSRTRFSTGGEFLASVGLVVDFGSFGRR